MSNTSIQLKKSGVTGNTPTGLNFGEVAINYADGKLYYKNSLGGTSYISNQFSFDTINANNSLILATGVSDTLSFVAGDNITITTNTATKTIAISATSGGTTSGGIYANGAFAQANAAYAHANAAFNAANTGGSSTDSVARSTANAAFVQANAAYSSQNTTGTYANSAYNQANTATTNASTADSKAITAGSYANSAYNQANTATTNAATADSKAVTAGSYANSAYTQANTATNNAAGASLYANGAFAQANAAYNSQNTIGSSVNSAFAQANAAYTQANTATTNAATADSKAVTAGSYANSAYTQANTSTNNAAGASLYANGAFIQANAAFEKANSGVANTSQTANVAINARITIVNTGIYYPIVTDTTITGNDTFHYSSNDFLMYAANNTFRASGNVWAGEFLAVGTNIPVVNSTGHWIGQTISGSVDTFARPVANSAALYANGAFVQANAAFGRANNSLIVSGYRANTVLVANSSGFVGNANIEFSSSNNTLYVFNANVSNSVSTNTILFYDGTRLSSASGIIASNAATANVAINARITIANTGVYYPIITDTTITGSDTFHFSNNSFLMYPANSTFRTSGNVWAGQFITVGTNTPVVNSTGHWIGQSITAVDDVARTTANAAFTKANTVSNIFNGTSNVFIATANGNIVANVSGNTVLTVTNTGIVLSGTNINAANNIYANTIIANGSLSVAGSGGDITGANNISSSVINVATAAIVAGINVIPHIQSAFTQANAAFLTANTPQAIANSAALYANAAFIQANAAFAAANAGGGGGAGTDTFARNTANAAFIQANAAFAAANAGGGGGGGSSNTGIIVNTTLFVANGNGSTFTVSATPQNINYTTVNIDGVLQLKSTYSVVGNTIILTEIPPVNSNVEVSVMTGGGSSSVYSRTSITATAGQTSFAVAYNVGFLEVYFNGALLNSTDYTATNGSTVVLVDPSVAGDIVEFVSFNPVSVTAIPNITLNSTNITANLAITTGYSGVSVGPLTIANGVSIAIADGQKWVIL